MCLEDVIDGSPDLAKNLEDRMDVAAPVSTSAGVVTKLPELSVPIWQTIDGTLQVRFTGVGTGA